MEDILKSDKVSDVFDKTDCVNLITDVQEDVKKFTKSVIGDKEHDLTNVYSYIREYTTMEQEIDDIANNIPGRFLIINYDKFEDIINLLLKSIDEKIKPIFKRHKFLEKTLRKDTEEKILA